jgi:Cu2+-exporting ATPase
VNGSAQAVAIACFHCGLPVPAGQAFQATVLAVPRDFCCPGCQTVAETIVSSGLENYYEDRDEPASGPAALPALKGLHIFDHPEAQRDFVGAEDGLACVDLSLDNLSCAACAWLIEKRLHQEGGVVRASVNLSNHRLHLVWNPEETVLSRLLGALQHIGYHARPFRADTHAAQLKQESRALLMRLAVAGLGMMQVMMYAGGLYIGVFQGIDPAYRDYLRIVSGIITTPIFFYAGWPFYASSWRALKARALNMDVSVSVALIAAYFFSVYATITRAGETYFDSVSMFIFFLLGSRFLELKARAKAGETANSLMALTPRLATRLEADGSENIIGASQLQAGDTVLVKAGEAIPGDGEVIDGQSTVTEALLTGEPLPIGKQAGDSVLGGSINGESALVIRIARTAGDSTLATLNRLLNRALAEKPLLAQKADRIAQVFVAAVLALSASVFIAWHFIAPDKALWITLAVLVATCPCALSLATPTVLSKATNLLASAGFLVTRGHVLETLTKATHIVFDKTGTLTEGRLRITGSHAERGDGEHWLRIACALESRSEHAVAKAFQALELANLPVVENLLQVAGSGITGTVEGRAYRLGHAEFALGTQADKSESIQVWLSDDSGPLASFTLGDNLRPDALPACQALHQLGLSTVLLSGDRSRAPYRVAEALGLGQVQGGLSPEQKREEIRRLQATGAVVIMVGDGVNDAPSLGQAHLSVAMASGTDLAQATADVMLLHDDLRALPMARRMALATQRIIRQNLGWALAYNIAILPPAALGLVPPWVAALGMASSSLIVVSNALRLRMVKNN